MGFLENVTEKIKQATDVVESVGDFAGSLGDFGSPQLNAVEKKEAARLQAKITAGQGLTDWEIKNVDYLTQQGASFSYPMEFMGGSGSNANAGIQQTGLLQDVGEALGVVPPTGSTNVPATLAGGGFAVPFWRGPGGGLQMPWNDPKIAEYLKQFALDDSYLRVYYRAPRGYVIVRDAQGRPYAVLRQIARQFGLWRPAAKPPISATDWKHYKRNQAIEKKLVKIARPALRHHTRPAATKTKRR